MKRQHRAILFAVIVLGLLAGMVGCSLDQLNRTEKAAEKVVVASTQPSATDALPYGELAKWLAGLGATGLLLVVRKLKMDKEAATKALRQVVTGVESALGPEKPELTKLKMEAAQDESTKALVGSIKKV